MRRKTFYARAIRSALRLSLLGAITICAAICMSAGPRVQSLAANQDDSASDVEGGVIDAVVIDVHGDQLTIAGGRVVDVSKAIVISIAGERLGNSIKPGMCIRASIVSSDASTSTLVADSVRLRLENEVVFSGAIQAVDLENGFITVLNQRIIVNDDTSTPIGFKKKKLKAGLQVSIIARPNGTDMVGTLILPNATLPRIFP